MAATTNRVMKCGPADVFAVLADGWSFGLWVVGASRIRAVDASWPSTGSSVHHSVGVWPLLIDDTTTVREVVDGSRLDLQARAWPAGEARVLITLEVVAAGTRVTMAEDAAKGPGLLIPKFLRYPLLNWRNKEALRRLAHLAEGRARS